MPKVEAAVLAPLDDRYWNYHHLSSVLLLLPLNSHGWPKSEIKTVKGKENLGEGEKIGKEKKRVEGREGDGLSGEDEGGK